MHRKWEKIWRRGSGMDYEKMQGSEGEQIRAQSRKEGKRRK